MLDGINFTCGPFIQQQFQSHIYLFFITSEQRVKKISLSFYLVLNITSLKNLFYPTRRSNTSHKTNYLSFFSLLNQTLNFHNWHLFCILSYTECGKFWVIITYFSIKKLIKSIKFFRSMF